MHSIGSLATCLMESKSMTNTMTDKVSKQYSTVDRLQEDKMWGEIRRMASIPENIALRDAVEKVKLIYELTKPKK